MVRSESLWQIVLFVIFFDTKGKDRQRSSVCQPPGGVFVEFIKTELGFGKTSNNGAPQIFSRPARPVSRPEGGGKVTPSLTWKYLDIVTSQEIASTKKTFVSLDLQKILSIFREFSLKIK